MLDINIPNNKKLYFNDERRTIENRAETIGCILRFLRNSTGLSQSRIAAEIGVAQQTYAGYENGKHEPSIELMIRLADLYELSLDLISGRLSEHETGSEEYDWLTNVAPYIQRQLESEREFVKMIIAQKKNASTEAEA